MITTRGKCFVGSVTIGDKIRFSTELLEQIKEDGDRTQLVSVAKIEEVEAGVKIVYLEACK